MATESKLYLQMKKILTGAFFSKLLIILSILFFIYKYWNTVLSVDEPKLIQAIFERVLLLTPSNQQWTGDFVINIFSVPLDFIAVISPEKFKSFVTFWLDNTNSCLNVFRLFYYLLIFVFILFINTKQGLLSAVTGTLLMEYFKLIPEFRLEVLAFYVLTLSLEKKSIALLLLSSAIKLLSIIFLPLAIIMYSQNSISSNLKKAAIYFFIFNSSIIVYPVLTSKAFLGDIFIKLSTSTTADFNFFANGLYPFFFFLIILLFYFKDLFRKISFKKIDKNYLSIVLLLFYCLVFIKMTGYLRYIFILLPFVLKFVFAKLSSRISYLYYFSFALICLNIVFLKSTIHPNFFNERNHLKAIYSDPDYAIEIFHKTFKNIPENNFYYQQILNDEKRNAKVFLDNY